jgi:hypothetical protein
VLTQFAITRRKHAAVGALDDQKRRNVVSAAPNGQPVNGVATVQPTAVAVAQQPIDSRDNAYNLPRSYNNYFGGQQRV